MNGELNGERIAGLGSPGFRRDGWDGELSVQARRTAGLHRSSYQRYITRNHPVFAVYGRYMYPISTLPVSVFVAMPGLLSA